MLKFFVSSQACYFISDCAIQENTKEKTTLKIKKTKKKETSSMGSYEITISRTHDDIYATGKNCSDTVFIN